MTPNIDDIRRDDELLDALGQRRPPHKPDQATDALAGWVRQIDAPARTPRPGRYSRTRRTRTRVGVIAAFTVATLSISGVAAAVGGMSGVAQQLGFVHRSSDFGSGAAGTASTSAPSSTRSAPAPQSDVATYGVTSDRTSASSSALPPRVLPGALRHASIVAEQSNHLTPSSTSRSTRNPSSTSSATESPTSTKPGKSPSSSSSPTSTTHTHTKKPPKPKPKPTPTPSSTSSPVWSPVTSPSSTPSSSSESSAITSSSTGHGSSPAR